ncbi:MAG: helix-turn-helix transcriptional regulator [Pseudomonadota bacterium]
MALSTGNQLKAARGLLGLKQSELAEAADIAVNTLRNLEAQGEERLTGHTSTIHALEEALENAGVELLNHGRPGVRLRP